MVAFARVLLATVALLAACSFGNGTVTFSEAGISFRYPEGWHVAGFSTTNSPRRLAVASFALPEDAVEGDCGGYRAVELLPRDGVLVLVIDYGWAGSFPDRLPELALRDGEFAEYECFGPSTMFRFRVGDRDLQAHVALGAKASDAMRERALAVLESLAVKVPPGFEPPTRQDGARVVLPVTFPDGTTAELVYPAPLGLERFTIRPYSSGTLADVAARDFVIVQGDVRRALADRNDGARLLLLAGYRDTRGGVVGLWRVHQAGTNVDYLGFQFGRWATLVYDYVGAGRMTDAGRASWVESFEGYETDQGWLVLDGTGPLRLARAGKHAGPRMLFSEPSGKHSSGGFELIPGRCRPHRDQGQVVAGKHVQWEGGFADWCLSGSMRMQARGDRRFVGTLIRQLEVRQIALGS